jgi:streptogramin lyase
MRTPVRAVLLGAAALAATLLSGVAPASAGTTAIISLPNCCISDTAALNGVVYALAQEPPGPGPERPNLLRIDPSTDAVTGSVTLLSGLAGGNALDTSEMAVAGGSIWIVSFFQNVVQRVDPVTMTVAATIPVGRSPSSIVSAGRSLWVALNHARKVIRINPARNLVVQRVRVGSADTSDSPSQLAYNGTELLAAMPNSGRVARIDPATGRVRYDAVGADAAACAKLLPVAGGYWLDDTECSYSYYRWNARARRISAVVTPDRSDWGAVVVNHHLYTGEFDCDDTGCHGGYLVKRDGVTGAEMSVRTVQTEAFLPHFAAASFWVADFDDSTLQRVARF